MIRHSNETNYQLRLHSLQCFGYWVPRATSLCTEQLSGLTSKPTLPLPICQSIQSKSFLKELEWVFSCWLAEIFFKSLLDFQQKWRLLNYWNVGLFRKKKHLKKHSNVNVYIFLHMQPLSQKSTIPWQWLSQILQFKQCYIVYLVKFKLIVAAYMLDTI